MKHVTVLKEVFYRVVKDVLLQNFIVDKILL